MQGKESSSASSGTSGSIDPATGEGRGLSAQRFVVYIVIAGVALFAMEKLLEYGAGDMMDPEKLYDWLSDHRAWAWIIILILWQVQAVIAPLPAPLLIMATALFYADSTTGVIIAIVLTWCGAMLGAIICFGLSRRFGRDWVMRKGYLDKMKNLDDYLEEKGAYVIFLTRLIPILSFDIVSYAAGLTRLRWKSFVIATGIGMIPTNVIFILFAAEALTQDQTGLIVMSVVGLIMLSIASYLLVWLMNDYEKWKKGRAGDAGTMK